MKLSDLLRGAADIPHEAEQLDVNQISFDSRQVTQGTLFFALPGAEVDGARFMQQAIGAGAVAVVTHNNVPDVDYSVPVIRSAKPRLVLARAASAFYQRQPEQMVAVTGTAGKTSVASFVRQIWAQQDLPAASIGTTGVVAPGTNIYGNLTTPDPIALHQLLKDLSENGVTHASMEASSHGLDQYRLDGVRLVATGFTNLGRDHLDYHPTVESYLKAKLRLFHDLAPRGSPAIIFADDPYTAPVVEAASGAGLDVRTVGRSGNHLVLKRVEHERYRQIVEIAAGGKVHRVEFPLAGDFQIANGLVAAGLAIASGVDVDDALSSLGQLSGAPGRLELIGKAACGAPAYVDYAHKPEALENVLQSVRPFTSNRVVLVIGCGGDRDPGKREIMGAISKEHADLTIVTDDNPRTEDPATIRKSMLLGNPEAIEIADRREAIKTAFEMLSEGDSLIVAGKGHEEGQIVGQKVLPFSDKQELQNLLRKAV